MYFPSKQVLSTESYTLLNNIRTSIGGEFMTATPLVQTAEDAKAYGLVDEVLDRQNQRKKD